jgi:hypothetical protein
MTTPRQRKFRIGPLTTIGEVCGELAKLYRRVAHNHEFKLLGGVPPERTRQSLLLTARG